MMRITSRTKMNSLLLSFIFSGLALLALPERGIPDGQLDKSHLSVSPGHARLIRLLEAQKAAAAREPSPGISGQDALTGKFSPPPVRELEANEQGKGDEAAGPQRVYMAGWAEDSRLILEGLSRLLSTRQLSGGAADLPLLQELNRLAAETAGRSSSLDFTGEEPLEPTKTEIEPNDSWAEAQGIEYGDIVAGSALPEKEFDIYSFRAGAGDFVRIEALPDGMPGWITARLFDPDSNLVSGGYYGLKEYPGSAEDSRLAPIIWPGGNIVAATLETEGTYYIVVSTLPGDIIFLDGTADSLNTTESSDEVSYILKIENLPTLPVTGKVVDDNRLPVAGAGLNFWSYEGLGGVQCISAEDGSFSLALPEGTYYASVASPPASRYPDGQIVDSFTVESRGAVLEFVLKSGVIFSGRTVNDRGEVVGNIGFNMVDREREQYHRGYSDQDGAFSVAVFPGTYDISLYSIYQYPPQPVIRGVRIEEDTAYDLILDTGRRVGGKVLGPDGSPLGGVSLTFRSEIYSRYAVSDENGAYLVALAAGEYWIAVRPAPEHLLPEQQVGPLDVNEDLTYDIKLAAGGVLSGSMIDSRGNPVCDALVNVWPVYEYPEPGEPADSIKTDDRIFIIDASGQVVGSADAVNSDLPAAGGTLYWNNIKRTSTDREGNWQIALVAGEYAVELIAPADYPPQSVRAGTFTVEEGGRTEVPQVSIDHGVAFSGRVLLPDGSPFGYGAFFMELAPASSDEITYAGNDAAISYPAIGRWGKWIYLDEQGAFQLRVIAGVYDLYFYQKTGEPASPRQRVEGVDLESDLELTINLQPGHLLSGRVIDPDRRGIQGCWLNFYSTDNIWHGSTVSAPDGTFSIQLIAGDYVVAVSPVAGYFPDSTRQAVSLTGDQALDIMLRPGVKVSGRVTDDSAGHGIGEAVVYLVTHYDAAEDSVIPLLPIDPTFYGEPAKREPGGNVIGADGMDAGSGLSPQPDMIAPLWSPYYFYASTDASGYWETFVKAGVYDIYAYSVRPGYNKTFLSAVDCTEEIEINLCLEHAEIVVNGRVEDEQGGPVSGALISLLDPNSGSHVSSYTNESGEFELELAQGAYELYVSGNDNGGGSAVTDVVELHSDSNLNIRLGEGILGDDGQSAHKRGLYKAYLVGGNYPNPFNPSTTISYTVDQPSDIRLIVFDIRGRRVITLVDRFQDQGVYHIQWDGTNSSGRALASGVYFYRMEAENYSVTRKMVLLK